MASGFQTLTGFRDFDPNDCQLRNYLFDRWRQVATRYGFVEYETPLLEPTELYLKKSGGELSSQLFRFEDQGGRDVTLRPEVTASLARLAAAKQRDYPKPLKWFEIGQCFRYEKPQKGRTREFYQFNTDILGDDSPAADAELIALAIDTMRDLGFGQDDFKVRLSDRNAWSKFATEQNLNDEQLAELLQVVDKLEREKPEVTAAKLAPLGLQAEQLSAFIADPANESEALREIQANLTARGLGDFIEVDLSIVRGLAYYTGVVFEIFDTKKSLRAVAGGGRYDTLVETLTDGKVKLPAMGFAMGDVVIGLFVSENANAQRQFEAWRQRNASCDLYVVIDDEKKRPEALALIQELRENGFRIDYPLSKTKFDKQLKAATATLAPFALVIGRDYPQLVLKNLSARSQEEIAPNTNLIAYLKNRLNDPEGPLLA
ncbi:histidine--tRNA ligase [Roseibacillus ishigakijimensis]|uniref:Histidine--tRNA ligase n=1 Tax=Roseibacillus ishigakijimensis TaxID=454146 RepID=A0A934VM45_9BACT|nr:histidine--tRNA ligase [Roseibacillus ishigakijimensis]MBK1833570.1 histidine--tRNA ligase [Roseibacillus ishigakijimensis]